MLGRNREAEPILRRLIGARPVKLRPRCETADPRGLQLDAHYLLFWVLIERRGCATEAFAMAEEHLRRRRRGLRSLWPVREVRADVAAMRRKWAGQEETAL